MSLEQDIADLRDELAAALDELRRVRTPVERLAWKISEAAERIGVKERTMYDLIAAGTVTAVRYSATGHQYVPDWSLRQLVQEPQARPVLSIAEAG